MYSLANFLSSLRSVFSDSNALFILQLFRRIQSQQEEQFLISMVTGFLFLRVSKKASAGWLLAFMERFNDEDHQYSICFHELFSIFKSACWVTPNFIVWGNLSLYTENLSDQHMTTDASLVSFFEKPSDHYLTITVYESLTLEYHLTST